MNIGKSGARVAEMMRMAAAPTTSGLLSTTCRSPLSCERGRGERKQHGC